MNPFNGIDVGSLVVITKHSNHNKSNISKAQVGKVFTVQDFEWQGRAHNRYIASVVLRNRDGEMYKAILDQVASVNPNYEPMGDIVVCTSCGVTIFATDMKFKRSLDIPQCPHCNALDPANS